MAARETGHERHIAINPISPRQWMTPSFSPQTLEAIVHAAAARLAVSAPRGTRTDACLTRWFAATVQWRVLAGRRTCRATSWGGASASSDTAQRITVDLGDEISIDFNPLV